MLRKETVKRVKSVLVKGSLLNKPEDLRCYSYDAAGKEVLPDLVVKVQDKNEVSAIVRVASEEQIPIIPRGAGTGFAGGSVPLRGGIVLCFSGMNKILEIDEKNLIAAVEPGVINYDLQKKIESYGLFYPPDPSSMKFSTLGGNVATCAGGPKGVKYGVTKDYVLGLEVVLPDGEIIQTGGKTVKSVAGYDLTKLIVGSEGTLAIITKIFLKLLPIPEKSLTMSAFFADIDKAADSVSAIIASKIIPSSIEFMDSSAIECVKDYSHIKIPENISAMLLIELDGEKRSVGHQSDIVKDILNKNGVKDLRVAEDEKDIELLWKTRISISPALGKIKPTKINQDIAVPRSEIPTMIKVIKNIAEKYNIIIVNFGHAGDGNIHVNIMTDINDKEEMGRVDRAVSDLFDSTLKLGGTISGEHGIGISKKRFLGREIGDSGLIIMKKIKKAFDPFNIMNPGKIV